MTVIKSGLWLLPSTLLCRDSPGPYSADPLSHSVMPALGPASWLQECGITLTPYEMPHLYYYFVKK